MGGSYGICLSNCLETHTVANSRNGGHLLRPECRKFDPINWKWRRLFELAARKYILAARKYIRASIKTRLAEEKAAERAA